MAAFQTEPSLGQDRKERLQPSVSETAVAAVSAAETDSIKAKNNVKTDVCVCV